MPFLEIILIITAGVVMWTAMDMAAKRGRVHPWPALVLFIGMILFSIGANLD